MLTNDIVSFEQLSPGVYTTVTVIVLTKIRELYVQSKWDARL